jgi:hypothetical protein
MANDINQQTTTTEAINHFLSCGWTLQVPDLESQFRQNNSQSKTNQIIDLSLKYF